ncbi:hypothetical protein L218DRAFT_968305 [Marasmius fiardii PR-910]|nr:hypothetical protein L218DRAFT_968305 [Marasmius fiardii PR-910]
MANFIHGNGPRIAFYLTSQVVYSVWIEKRSGSSDKEELVRRDRMSCYERIERAFNVEMIDLNWR